MRTHRCHLARIRAGLSVTQAAHLLGVERDDLWDVEAACDPPGAHLISKMVDVYDVRREWIAGEIPRYDYDAVRKMPGWEDLTFADRDAVAEFAASAPRRAL